MRKQSAINLVRVFCLLVTITLVLSAVKVFAHGGEDHGDEKPQAAQTTANMTVRVARLGDYEVTFKHPNLVPDKEIPARLFITSYNTNEPLKNAKVVVLVTDNNGTLVEVSASATNTPGLYEIKLPPLPQRDYKLSVRVDISGSLITANFGDVQVRIPEVETPPDAASWARTALIVLGGVVLLALLGIVIFIALKQNRRKQVDQEAIAA